MDTSHKSHTVASSCALLCAVLFLSSSTLAWQIPLEFNGPGLFSDDTRWIPWPPFVDGQDIVINDTCTFDTNRGLTYGTLRFGSTTKGIIKWMGGPSIPLQVAGISNVVFGGRIDMSYGGQLILKGPWLDSGIEFVPGTGIVVFADAASKTTTLPTYGSYMELHIDVGAGNEAVADPFVPLAVGDLRLASGVFNPNGVTIRVARDLILDGGTLPDGSAPIRLNGLSTQVIRGTAPLFRLASLIIDKSIGSVAYVAGNVTEVHVSGNLSITSGELADSGRQIVSDGGGQLNIASGAKLSLGSYNLATTFPMGFVYNLNSSSWISYVARPLQDISMTPTCGNLDLLGGPKRLAAVLRVNSRCTIRGGASLEVLGSGILRTQALSIPDILSSLTVDGELVIEP